jgi:mycothiol system anti-sigma-R factor
MECTQARRRLDPYLDGELTPAEQADLERHVAGCADCEARLGVERAVRGRVAAVLAEEGAPEPLRDRIRVQVRDAAAESFPEATNDPSGAAGVLRGPGARAAHRRLRVGLALAAILAGLFVVWNRGFDRSSVDPVVQSWANALARDMTEHHGASGHDALVEETDPHRLAAWFQGRTGVQVTLPETPPGARLLGGQVCLVDGALVAHLVYGLEGATTVSYFVLPHGLEADEPQSGRASAFNFVVRKAQQGSVYVMGSVAPRELARFVS